MAKYDQIGTNYNNTRRSDPYLLSRLHHLLNPDIGKKYLDIGCGTGNYTVALKGMGLDFVGVDPSLEMLEKAKVANDKVLWKKGTAESVPLKSNSIDGIVASLTIHHWTDLGLSFKELSRVLKANRPIVIFTSTPEQMKGYWLNHYFPKMMKDSIKQMPSSQDVQYGLELNGLKISTFEKYFIKKDLKDLFLYSGKHHPQLYLDPIVRSGISSFSSLANAKEVNKGLEVLKQDIRSNQIAKIINDYENDKGDYLFIVAE